MPTADSNNKEPRLGTGGLDFGPSCASLTSLPQENQILTLDIALLHLSSYDVGLYAGEGPFQL